MLFAKKPVNNLDDLKGLKIRSTGTSAKVVQALGGAPVAMPMSEAYDALSKGVVQGIIGPYEPMKGFKLAEVVSHSTEYGSAYLNTNYVVMNKDKWNALPPDIKKIFDEVAFEAKEWQAALWNEMDIEGRDFFKSQGGQVIPLADAEANRWIKAVEPVTADYKKSMGSKGYKEADVDSWLSYIKERTEYWKKEEKQRGIPGPF